MHVSFKYHTTLKPKIALCQIAEPSFVYFGSSMQHRPTPSLWKLHSALKIDSVSLLVLDKRDNYLSAHCFSVQNPGPCIMALQCRTGPVHNGPVLFVLFPIKPPEGDSILPLDSHKGYNLVATSTRHKSRSLPYKLGAIKPLNKL